MTNDDKTRFLEILTVLSDIFDKALTELTVEMYFKTLQKYDIEMISSAAQSILDTKTFHKFPLPAEFIQFINPQEPPELKERFALNALFYAMETYGANESVAFDDPIIHHVIEYYGGWQGIIRSRRHAKLGTDDRFWQKEFMDVYQLFALPDLKECARPPCVGILQENYLAGGGIWHGKIYRIGEGGKSKRLGAGEEVPLLTSTNEESKTAVEERPLKGDDDVSG